MTRADRYRIDQPNEGRIVPAETKESANVPNLRTEQRFQTFVTQTAATLGEAAVFAAPHRMAQAESSPREGICASRQIIRHMLRRRD